MVKPKILVILHHLDASPPRVEDEANLEQPRDVAHGRPVREPLQPDP